jgi:GH25 family lysozyme M1 (1,4-beta-N-acetylmuramidase)
MPVAPRKILPQIFIGKTRFTTFLIFFFALGTLEIFAQRPLGIDVSSYQGSDNSPKTNIVWTSVKNSGVTFAWAKATEGVTVTDADFIYNATNAKAAGVFIGAYDFAHPENNSPSAEANHFWSVAGGYIKGDGLSVQPALDYETFTASNNIPVGASSYGDWANQWCSNIVSKAAAVGVTVKPVIYTSTYEAGYLNSSDAQWLPWIANPSGESAQTGSPWHYTSYTNSNYEIWGSNVWTAWQYDWYGTVPGIIGDMDLDVFNGTSNQMVATLVIPTNFLPSVVLTSQLNRVVDAGGSASFSATATGTSPLNFQWFLNGAKIPGANTNFYNLVNAQTNNAGNYALVVTNFSGSVTSSVVSLTVYPPQATVFADNFDANTATNWIVNKSSSDNSVSFSFDYSALGIPSAPHSTNGTTRGAQMKANLTLGVCAALSISPTNQSFSGDYRLHFDAWINVNGPLPGGGASSTEFLTAGIGTAGNRVEWTTNASADGYYFSADGDGGVSSSSTTFGDYSGYIGKNWQTAGGGIYAAGSLDNANSYYTSAFPTGQSAPALQQSNYPQQTGALANGTFGLAWHDVIISRRGSTVNWSVDGILFATISNATFTASNVFVGFWDPFASLTDNTNLSFGLVDNVRVEVPATAPIVSIQPQSQTVKLGTNVIFTVAASGLPSPNLQWRFNGTNIFGATNSSYALAFVAATNTGNYSVTATNVAGSVTSSNALLALIPPNAAQFQSISVQNGNAVQISFTGDAYWTYTIETSTNLTSWSALTNLTSANGAFSFTAGNVTNAPQQFFRARVGP